VECESGQTDEAVATGVPVAAWEPVPLCDYGDETSFGWRKIKKPKR